MIKMLNQYTRVAITLVVVVLLGGSAFAGDPGVTKNKILIGAYLPLQGGLAAGANQVRDGADAYFKYVNESGGINGRKIEWLVENDSYNPQQTVAVTKKLVDRDGVFAIVSTLGTSTNLAAIPFLVERGVPLINPAGGHKRLNKPTDRIVFGLVPEAVDYGISMAEYALDKLGAKHIAIFYQNDQWGKDPRDGVVEALAKRGLKPVAEASYIPSDVDVSAQAISLKESKADTVIMGCITKHGSLFLKEAQKLSWKPKVVTNNTMGDPITPGLAGSALDDTIIDFFTAIETMQNDKVQKANEILAKYYPKTKPGYWAYLGMGGAMVFVEGVRRAGQDLTREKLITALESFKGFETGVFPPITWGPGNHSSPGKYGFAVWKDGTLKVIQGW